MGTAKIICNENGIQSVIFLDEKVPTSIEIAACLKDCVLKLNKYFEGKKTEFEFTIHPKATTFQLKV
ncbi:hypothetical protein [Polaribacter sp.]|uniref:hypothetical protein n=1 Tax=Polaribacter sp. TaxID=1920175 RepID=UPI00404807DA